MNTRNNINSSNSDQSQHLASPFAALTMNDGQVALTPTSVAPAKTEHPKVATLALPKNPTRRLPALPSRRKTVSTDSAQLSNNVAANDTASGLPQGTSALPEAVKEIAQTVITAPAIETKVDAAPAAAPALTGWDLLLQHKQNGKNIRGHVTRVIHSKQDSRSIVGVKVRVAGLDGFVPFRMLGLCPLDAEQSVTLEMGFRVVELEKGSGEGQAHGKKGAKDRIILNRQLVITQEKSATLLASLKKGDTVTGVIRNIVSFGAFVDVDGASALIHVNDLPNGNISSVKVGQEVKAIVVKIDPAKNQLGVSIKHYFVSQLAVGAEFTGRVKNEESFGVFVQLDETVDGLVHVSQFGDFTPARGDFATVKVLSKNPEKGQVQLGLLDLKVAQAD
jgi:predicted RNA-binding protein with RPS1 domain